MFRGFANATLDAKGRMPLPARFREQVIDRCEGRVVLTVDIQSKCLLLYCVQDWDRLQREVHAISNMNEQTRTMQRVMIGLANDLELDSNGRLLVAQSLRDIAGLDKRVVVTGQTNKIEIWDEALWQSSAEQWLSPESRKAMVTSDEFTGLSV